MITHPFCHKGKRKRKKKVSETAEYQRFLKNAKKEGYSVDAHGDGVWCFNPPKQFW